jgi:phospholipase C
MARRRSTLLLALLAVSVIAAACTGATASNTSPGSSSEPATSSSDAPGGIFKLDHLIFIVQENRSFDHYFGTYPGADGIPTKPDGSFKPCGRGRASAGWTRTRPSARRTSGRRASPT